jgi:pimeloyl-ACP methyl ester carboxylesterase
MSPQKKTKDILSGLLGGLGITLGAGVAAGGGWIAYSNSRINHHLPMPEAVEADRQIFSGKTTGKLSYYVDRQASGRPLVLVHSINAAASAYELRNLFNHFRSRRPVFAIDLPGFGFSDRTRRSYSPFLYIDAILDLLNTQIGEPADVIALSLGSEFAARAALYQPDRFNSLTFISPSGLSPAKKLRASQQAQFNGASDSLYSTFSTPLWSRAFYDLIATRRSIEFFLKQSFVGPVPPELIEYAYLTSHQPGAHYAPVAFVSGTLFTPSICSTVYELLKTPTLVIYDRDSFVRFDRLPELLQKNPSFQAERIAPTLGLPQFEKLPETINALDTFWQGLKA